MAHKNHPLSREQSIDYYAGERARRSHHRLAIGVVVAVFVIFCTAAVAIGLYTSRLNANMAPKDDELLASLKKGAPNEPFYLLLLGVDKGEERYEDVGEDDSLYRADTIMLCRIDPKAIKATLISIHRDLYVELDENLEGNVEGETEGKINAAYSLGGPSGMVRQVSKLAGVDISHYAEIDFDTFMELIDTIGGVEVTLPVAISDPDYTGLELEAGTQTLNSHDALMLSRSRHAYDEYGDGDLYRAANQRAIIASILRKVLASSPQDMISSITAMSKSLTTDMTLDEILALASQFRDFNPDEDLYTGMTPTEGELIDDVYYEILDVPAWTKMMQRVDAGLPPYDSDASDVTAGVASSTDSHATVAPTTNAQTSRGSDSSSTKQDASLKDVDKSGSVMVAGYIDGAPTEITDRLVAQGFDATAYESEEFTFDQKLVVYENEAHAEEAEAIASYLGDGYTAIMNDGSFYMGADIVVRVAS